MLELPQHLLQALFLFFLIRLNGSHYRDLPFLLFVSLALWCPKDGMITVTGSAAIACVYYVFRNDALYNQVLAELTLLDPKRKERKRGLRVLASYYHWIIALLCVFLFHVLPFCIFIWYRRAVVPFWCEADGPWLFLSCVEAVLIYIYGTRNTLPFLWKGVVQESFKALLAKEGKGQMETMILESVSTPIFFAVGRRCWSFYLLFNQFTWLIVRAPL